MADQTLSNGGAGGTLNFNTNQVNSFTLKTANLYSATNIALITKVTKAVLDGTTDHTQFTIQIPNGSANPINLVFTTVASDNNSFDTVVTGSNVST